MAKKRNTVGKEKGCCSCCSSKCCAITAMIGAVVGAALAISMPFIVSAIMDNQLRLIPGTVMYKFWEESPVPMYIRFYFFNVTNSEDVVNNKAKPIVQELGPYTYSEVHYRVNVKPHNENYTLEFMQKREWKYIEEMSNGSLDDVVTTLNSVLISAATAIRFENKLIKSGFNQFIDQVGSELFIKQPVRALLFEGYSDPLLDAAALVPPQLGITIPQGYDKFGWFYGRNMSEAYDGVFSVFTGEDDISKLDELDMWNYTRKTSFYESYCGMVNGSFGEGWPPRRERTSISMYSSDLCRSIDVDYTEDVVKNGVTFYRYAGTEKMFGSADKYPDNWCFCSGGVCNPTGVTNSSTCRFGAPAFVSFPHYYLADPFFKNQVEGLNPQKELHEFHIDLEPRTAVPLQVAARFQINIQMQPIDGIKIVQDINEVYVPVIWFSVTADLSDRLLGLVKFSLIGPYIGSASFFLMFCSCLGIVAYIGIKYVKEKNKAKLVVVESGRETYDKETVDNQFSAGKTEKMGTVGLDETLIVSGQMPIGNDQVPIISENRLQTTSNDETVASSENDATPKNLNDEMDIAVETQTEI